VSYLCFKSVLHFLQCSDLYALFDSRLWLQMMSYQENVGGIPLNSSTKPHFYSCLKLRPDVLSAYSAVMLLHSKTAWWCNI